MRLGGAGETPVEPQRTLAVREPFAVDQAQGCRANLPQVAPGGHHPRVPAGAGRGRAVDVAESGERARAARADAEGEQRGSGQASQAQSNHGRGIGRAGVSLEK